MLEKILRFVEKFIPKKLYKFAQPIYHFALALAGAILYRFPGKKIYVIGITGTKGKSSTAEFVNKILEEDGKINNYKTALLSTIRFKIGDEEKRNLYKMTMPGRFFVQKFLYDAVKANCKYAVMEMTSEGAKFYRHMFTFPNTLIFTNLSPEHIESHGGFENYKNCKLKLARAVQNSGKESTSIVANGEDKYADEFLNFNVKNKIKYYKNDADKIKLNVDGEFNKMNAAAAKAFALSIGIDEDTVDSALFDLKEIPGRVQHIKIKNEQNFEVIVDYAHTEDSLEKLYKTYEDNYVIGVLGSCGGGRDKDKRPKLGTVAYKYCSEIIITDEDPYDDNPREIMDDVASGINNFYTNKNYKIIENRREAIHYAISRAQNYINNLPQDIIKAANIMPRKPIVIISGKGTDPYIMRANNKKEKWSDAEVAREELEKVLII
jgi:UDP-N-acetylmuramoyl-L-alanyl-D-glutamate--2,6-diaminopimelate ligase